MIVMRVLLALLSLNGLAYSLNFHSGSHLDALLSLYPLMYLPLAVILISYFLIPFAVRYPKLQAIFIFSLPIIIPLFGEAFLRSSFNLLLLGLVFNLSLSNRKNLKGYGSPLSVSKENFFGVVFVIYFFAYLTSLWFRLDLLILWSQIETNQLKGLVYFLRANSELWRNFVFCSEILQLSFLVSYTYSNFSADILSGSVRKALNLLLPILFVTLLNQAYIKSPIFLINQNAFWDYSKRYAGTFTDPNAFGVIAGILVSYFAISSLQDRMGVLKIVSLFLMSLWSGSRTFFIFAFGLIFRFILAFLEKRARMFTFGRILLLISMFLLSIILVFAYKDNLLSSPYMPQSIQRLALTLDPEQTSSMLDSRSIYSRIALYGIQKEPLHGVGLGEFINRQEGFARAINIDLNNWRDNANNYFLQLAVEAGLPSLLILLSSILYLVRSASFTLNSPLPEVRAIKYLFLLFGISLLTGPHIHFLEIRLLLSIFLAMLIAFSLQKKEATNRREKQGRFSNASLRTPIILSTCILLLVSPYVSNLSLHPSQVTRGLYEEELGEDERSFRWTSGRALIPVKNYEYMELRSPLANYNIESKSQNVIISFFSRDAILKEVNIDLTASESWERVPIPNGANNFSLRVYPAISPKALGISSDNRVLGVQLRL